jgi:hypothetical protein
VVMRAALAAGVPVSAVHELLSLIHARGASA